MLATLKFIMCKLIVCCLAILMCVFVYHFLRIITGFGDKEGTREFLFALPRFAADEVNILYV